MVALRLLAVDDISFRSWECSHLGAYGDIWVIFMEKNLFPEFLRHFLSRIRPGSGFHAAL